MIFKHTWDPEEICFYFLMIINFFRDVVVVVESLLTQRSVVMERCALV